MAKDFQQNIWPILLLLLSPALKAIAGSNVKNDSSNKSISHHFSKSPKKLPHSSSSGLTARLLYHITGVDTCVTERSSYWPAGETPAGDSDCGDTTWIFTFSRHNNSQHRILHQHGGGTSSLSSSPSSPTKTFHVCRPACPSSSQTPLATPWP